jgi:hypothetical protein
MVNQQNLPDSIRTLRISHLRPLLLNSERKQICLKPHRCLRRKVIKFLITFLIKQIAHMIY